MLYLDVILRNFYMIKDENQSSMQGYMFFIYFAYVGKCYLLL